MTYHFKRKPTIDRGIICGAEVSQQWLLPWWWCRFKEHNSLPVTFCDFGMTEEMKDWCKERGELIAIELDSYHVAGRNEVDERLAKEWESLYGWNVWHARRTWFKKPFAFLSSRYKRAIWIDLDCEILGNLETLFSLFDAPIALVRDFGSEAMPKLHPNVRYNGGVVAFEHGAKIVEKWAQAALTLNHVFGGDDPMLSHLIYEHQLLIQELPEIYNWRMVRGLNLSAVILHWIGNSGKAYIRTHGGLKPSLDSFYQGCRTKF